MDYLFRKKLVSYLVARKCDSSFVRAVNNFSNITNFYYSRKYGQREDEKFCIATQYDKNFIPVLVNISETHPIPNIEFVIDMIERTNAAQPGVLVEMGLNIAGGDLFSFYFDMDYPRIEQMRKVLKFDTTFGWPDAFGYDVKENSILEKTYYKGFPDRDHPGLAEGVLNDIELFSQFDLLKAPNIVIRKQIGEEINYRDYKYDMREDYFSKEVFREFFKGIAAEVGYGREALTEDILEHFYSVRQNCPVFSYSPTGKYFAFYVEDPALIQ